MNDNSQIAKGPSGNLHKIETDAAPARTQQESVGSTDGSGEDRPCKNTDTEIWRERRGDYYADSIHVTEHGGIGINCGGHVIVAPVRRWHDAGEIFLCRLNRGKRLMQSQTPELTSVGLHQVVGHDHPNDGRQWECQCARCGSSLAWESCNVCGGEGITGPGELHEEDPLWYDPDDYEPCSQCGGVAAWPVCLSTPEWCEANALPGRTGMKCSTPEWFVVPNDQALPPLPARKSHNEGA